LVPVGRACRSSILGLNLELELGLKTVRLSDDILPIGAVKTNFSKVVGAVRDDARTVVITQHGRPAAVLLSPGAFDELCDRNRFLSAVLEGMRDAEVARTISDEELGALLDQEFGPLG
jgi:prevent-host-death family protein